MRLFKINYSNERIYGLDILRSAAILFVLIDHGSFILTRLDIPQKYLTLLSIDGVSIFFVLSGFLIGKILIKTIEQEGTTFRTLINFWQRRWLRTLPNYFLVLIILILFTSFYKNEVPDNIFQYFLFIQNFSSNHPDFFPEAWSLSVEEWFYLITPSFLFILISFFKGYKKSVILFFALIIILASILVRQYKFNGLEHITEEIWDDYFRKQVITRLDSLMFGVIGALLSYYFYSTWIKYKKSLFIFALLIIAIIKLSFYVMDKYGLSYNEYYCIYSFSFMSLGVLLMLPYLSEWKRGKGFIYKCINYISLTSYSMYLINLTLVQELAIPFTLETFSIQPGTFSVVMEYLLFWLYTIVGSILLYKYFEVPFMRLRTATSSLINPKEKRKVKVV